MKDMMDSKESLASYVRKLQQQLQEKDFVISRLEQKVKELEKRLHYVS